MSFSLNWVDDPDSEHPILQEFNKGFIANRLWRAILDEIEKQGVGDFTEPPPPPPRSFLERLMRRSPPVEVPGEWLIDVDPDNCSYPIPWLYLLAYHGIHQVSARACQALHQRLSREPLSQIDHPGMHWPRVWYWFYDFLGGAIEHGGFEVG
ncbi:MAG TPA: hypothetical protein VLK36_00300 [Gaiellaceae bacterium]|nr:hypothetical protein [Gaiellaceae bacterium]